MICVQCTRDIWLPHEGGVCDRCGGWTCLECMVVFANKKLCDDCYDKEKVEMFDEWRRQR